MITRCTNCSREFEFEAKGGSQFIPHLCSDCFNAPFKKEVVKDDTIKYNYRINLIGVSVMKEICMEKCNELEIKDDMIIIDGYDVYRDIVQKKPEFHPVKRYFKRDEVLTIEQTHYKEEDECDEIEEYGKVGWIYNSDGKNILVTLTNKDA